MIESLFNSYLSKNSGCVYLLKHSTITLPVAYKQSGFDGWSDKQKY